MYIYIYICIYMYIYMYVCIYEYIHKYPNSESLKMSTHQIHSPLNSGIDRNEICAGGGHAVKRRNLNYIYIFDFENQSYSLSETIQVPKIESFPDYGLKI